jgi:hypothetical protein
MPELGILPTSHKRAIYFSPRSRIEPRPDTRPVRAVRRNPRCLLAVLWTVQCVFPLMQAATRTALLHWPSFTLLDDADSDSDARDKSRIIEKYSLRTKFRQMLSVSAYLIAN